VSRSTSINRSSLTFSETFFKNLFGKKDIEDALKKLDALTMEEARMAIAETLKVVNRVDIKVDKVDEKLDKVDVTVITVENKVDKVDNKVDNVDYKIDKMDDKVDKVDDTVGRMDDTISRVDDKVAVLFDGEQNRFL
jgi:peptidoglycan hydrolase CwlO-like protein